MAEPNFSIGLTAQMLATTECEVGDALVFNSALGYWVVATAANRTAANARSQAIALTANGESAVGSVSYQSAGVLAASKSRLNSTASQKLVRVSSTGRLERIDSYTAGDDVVGYAEPDGRVHLHMGIPWADIAALAGPSMPPGWYNVADYGATGDGTTDDAAAITATIQASGSAAPRGATIHFPPGVYRVASSINVTRNCVLRGVVNGPWPVSQIKADSGVTAIIVHSSGTTPETSGDGSSTIIKDLLVESTVVALAVRANSTAYSVGDKRRRLNDNRFYLECTTAGTTASSPPTFANNLYDDNTTTDGSVVWTTRIHAGILAHRRCHIENVFAVRFTNSGIAVRASTEDGITNANGATIEKCRVVQCGVGIEVGAGDGNVVKIDSCDVESAGYNQSGTGGFGYVDGSFLGVVFINCQAAVCTGKAFYTHDGGVGYSTFLGCYSEADCLPSNVAGVVIGGDWGSGFDADSRHTGYAGESPILRIWHRLGVRDATHAKIPIVQLDGTTGFLTRLSNDDPGYAFLADRYEYSGNPAGWWVTGLEGTLSKRIVGVSGSKAAEGNGHWRSFRGEFRGDGSDPYYLGVADDSTTDRWVRVTQGVGGHFLPGDRFEPLGDGTGAIGQVVTAEGWATSFTWATGVEYIPYNYHYDGSPSHAVVPTTPNGYVYVCTKRGLSHASTEPTWPTTYLGSGGICPYKWRTGTTYKVGDYISPATRNGHYYRCTAAASADANGFSTVGGSEPTWPTGSGSTVVDGNVTWTEQGSDVGTYVADNATEWQCVGPVPTFEDYGTIGEESELPAPGTSGNVLTSNGSAWTSAAPPSGASVTGTGFWHSTSGTLDAAAKLVVNADVDAAAAIAGTKISPDFGSQNVVTTGYISVGSSPAGAGIVRIPNNQFVYAKNSSAADHPLIGITSGNVLQVGTTGSGGASVSVFTNGSDGGTFSQASAGTTRLELTDSTAKVGVPVGGLSSALRFRRLALSGTSTQTLSSSQAESFIIEVSSTGDAQEVILPLVDGATYIAANKGSGQNLTFKGATGTGVALDGGDRTLIYCDGTNYNAVAGIPD